MNGVTAFFWICLRLSLLLLLLLRILKKSLAQLPAPPACVHHTDEQRAGAILRIAEPFFEHAHDVQADVQSDEIRQSQWTHWMRHSELEDLVDRLWSRHTLHHRKHGLVQKRHQDAVRDEACGVVDLHRRLA